MSRKYIQLAATAIFFLVCQSAAAQSSCNSSCPQSAYCDTQCWTCDFDYQDNSCPPNETHYETCGDFSGGNCQCRPNWVQTSRVKIGGNVTYSICFIGCQCHNVSYFLATYHDTNCGQPDYTQCETDAVDYFAYHESECCFYTDPSDISHSDYCGGSSC